MLVTGRHTARYQGSLTVFVIGMRINRIFPISRWWNVAKTMPAMLAELSANPESGYLGGENLRYGMRTVCFIQYWRDFASLEAYGRDPDQIHWPAWRAFNRAIGEDGSVGIFHETYVVEAGGFETIYNNVPPFGLGKVAGLVKATGSRMEARQRLGGGSGADEKA